MKKLNKIVAIAGVLASTIALSDNARNLDSAFKKLAPSQHYNAQAELGNVVADGGFESGSPSSDWTEASTNFGSPICSEALCGLGGTSAGPNSGDFWVWFGGIAASEVGSVSQDVTIPNGAAFLHFFLKSPACDSAADFMAVDLDGTEVFRISGDDASCTVDEYVQQNIDITAFGDGNSHTLTFSSEVFGTNATSTNFWVDDVSIDGTFPVELMNFSID